MNDTTRLPTAPDRRSNRGKVERSAAERICVGCCKGVCGDGPVPAGGPARAAEGGNVTQAEIMRIVVLYRMALSSLNANCFYEQIEAALTAAGVPK